MPNSHPRLFFVHVPKCGGMTLHAIIERQYEPEAIYTVPSVDYNDKNYEALCNEWAEEDKARLRVVKGHMEHGWHKAFGDDPYEYLSLVRHPVERVLSFYSFIGDWHPAHSGSIDELLEKSDEVHNQAVYMLSGGMGRNVPAFEKAWANVLNGRFVAGILEEFDTFVSYLRRRYGWSELPYEIVNKTPNRVRQEDISNDDWQKILKANWLDMLIHSGIKGLRRSA